MSRCSNSSPRYTRENGYAIFAHLKISYVFNYKISITLLCSMSGTRRPDPNAKLRKSYYILRWPKVLLRASAAGGFGPRDSKGSQEHGQWRGPTHNPNLSGFILTCYFVLSLSSPPAEAQRAPTSCSPPRGVAANCTVLRAAEARLQARPNSPPRVRLTAAPLSLRHICRRPLGFHLDFASRKTNEIPLQAGGRRILRVRIKFFARLGKSCQNVPAHFDDFPFKAWRAEHFNRRPLGFHLDFAHRKTNEIPFYAGGRQNRTLSYSLFARLTRFILFRLAPK